MKLSQQQSKRLTRLVLTNDASGGPWSTMQSLIDKGLAADVNGRLVATDKWREHVTAEHNRIVGGAT